MRIDFDTTGYEFSHGHAPHGFGSWAFEIHNGRDFGDPIWTPDSMIYGDAKKWMCAEVRRMIDAGDIPALAIIDLQVCS